MLRTRTLLAVATALALLPNLSRADPIPPFLVTNLVSNQPGKATTFDPNLVNAWGLDASARSPWWISDNVTGLSTLYNGNTGAIVPLVVTIPPPANQPGVTTASPTGLVANTGTGFNIPPPGNGKPAAFLFSTEDGTIAAWNGGANAVRVVDNSNAAGTGAVYKGLTINKAGTSIYATNFRAGTVEQFNGSFVRVNPTGFQDPGLPPTPPGTPGFAPFGIRDLKVGGQEEIFVTYAMQRDAMQHDDNGVGGFIDVFGLNGSFIKRLVTDPTGQHLNSPWGLALAPSSFPGFGGDLLVGNFGDGTINAFDPNTGAFLDTLRGPDGNPLVIDGLWGLSFGNGAAAGPANSLFFTAGPDGETNGLFGRIDALPEPPTAALFAVAGAGLLLLRRRQARPA